MSPKRKSSHGKMKAVPEPTREPFVPEQQRRPIVLDCDGAPVALVAPWLRVYDMMLGKAREMFAKWRGEESDEFIETLSTYVAEQATVDFFSNVGLRVEEYLRNYAREQVAVSALAFLHRCDAGKRTFRMTPSGSEGIEFLRERNPKAATAIRKRFSNVHATNTLRHLPIARGRRRSRSKEEREAIRQELDNAFVEKTAELVLQRLPHTRKDVSQPLRAVNGETQRRR